MSTRTGSQAEGAAASYLEGMGLKLLERNWRTRWCEIDLVARAPSGRIHFVEVKYRRSNLYGSGVDYVTAAKQRQLRQAVRFWISHHPETKDCQIDVMTVAGSLEAPDIEYLPNAVSE